jgi:hypothetical protein
VSNFAVPIKRPEILDEFTRALIESLAMPGVQQQPRKNNPRAVKRRRPRFKLASKETSSATRSALLAHALSGRRR